MNPIEIVHFIEELIQSETKVIAFVLVSVGITLVGVYSLRKWIFPAQDAEKLKGDLSAREATIAQKEKRIIELEHKIEGLQEKYEDVAEKHHSETAILKELNARLAKNCHELETENGTLAADVTRLGEQYRKAQADAEKAQNTATEAATQFATKGDIWKKNQEILKKNEDYYKTRKRFYKTQYLSILEKVKQFEQSNKQLESIQGRFWEFPVKTAVPPFRKLQAGDATIIAITNLKGGVGKTTLSASIAVTYRQMGKRVLLIDLDQQGSLTNRCLTEQEVSSLRKDNRFVESVFRARSDFASVAMKNKAYAKECDFDILPASESLFDVEEHAKAEWLVNLSGFDIRYILRAALHDSVFQKGYDIILLDCPPRWTPASINAMTCSDFVLVPMLLDPISAEAVPRLLGWLYHLKTMNVCPDLRILGVIGNNTLRKKPLIKKEASIWAASPTNCEDKWNAPVHHFENVIKKFSTTKKIAALDGRLRPVFWELVKEIEIRRSSP